MRTLDSREPHSFQTVGGEQLGGRLGAGLHVGRARGVGADARDAHELLELSASPVLCGGGPGDGVIDRCHCLARPSPKGASRSWTACLTPTSRSFGMYSFDDRWWRPSAWSSVVARRPVRMPCASIARWTLRLLSASRSPGTCATRSAIVSTSPSN